MGTPQIESAVRCAIAELLPEEDQHQEDQREHDDLLKGTPADADSAVPDGAALETAIS